MEQPEYIAPVPRLGSVRRAVLSRAAGALRLSQSASSGTVRKPEREPGVHLLERERPGCG
ncbi:hypothetical protein BKI49_01180 [Streptomyces sp. Tue6028]|uniref:LysR family transcriptional regulator n=1 Tax=Streptomyces sp. Tue6028 TaxID=2036037 RepID=UPI000BB30E71|nr:hypothetical protein BKI49_01180 [Streptomyces sp. Tue6028]